IFPLMRHALPSSLLLSPKNSRPPTGCPPARAGIGAHITASSRMRIAPRKRRAAGAPNAVIESRSAIAVSLCQRPSPGKEASNPRLTLGQCRVHPLDPEFDSIAAVAGAGSRRKANQHAAGLAFDEGRGIGAIVEYGRKRSAAITGQLLLQFLLPR